MEISDVRIAPEARWEYEANRVGPGEVVAVFRVEITDHEGDCWSEHDQAPAENEVGERIVAVVGTVRGPTAELAAGTTIPTASVSDAALACMQIAAEESAHVSFGEVGDDGRGNRDARCLPDPVRGLRHECMAYLIALRLRKPSA
jgi:chitodextrinase